MSEPIKRKVGQLAAAPTPQNTPASVTNSFMKNNAAIPTTINEEDEMKKNLLSNPAFISMIQGKLGTLVGRDSGYIGSLTKDVKERIFSLKAVQEQQIKLEYEFQKELFELEKKYLAKYEPIYQHRSDIISGRVEPTAEEIAKGKQIESELEGEDDEDKIEEEDEEAGAEGEEGQEKAKGIPQFWLTALENLHPISETITERDSEVLSYLTNIKLEYLDKPGFRLVFEFKENEFFSNKSLSKTYYYQEELGYSGDFIYDFAEGDEIKWKSADLNVTVVVERRKQRNKNTKQVRTIEKLTPVESFFNFFDPPKVPNAGNGAQEGDAADEDELEEEDQEELEQRLALDYQIGEEIKDKLIPRAIDWFTGVAVDYEGYEEDEFDDEEEEDEDEDEDEEEEDDDEDEDDDEADGEPKQQPPECKQS